MFNGLRMFDKIRAMRTFFLRVAALTMLAAGTFVGPAVAQQPVPLPIFSACKPAAAPKLPERWRAVGLMMPFVHHQLDVGEFVYDRSLPAMRATIYGVELGAVDLLITDKETYRLSGPHRSPDGCTALGPKYSLPSDSLLPRQSACIGDSPLAGKPMHWWKSPAPDGRAKWYVFKPDTKLPRRVVVPSPSSEPPVIGEYGMTNFASFAPLQETNLAKLRDFCISHAKTAEAGPATTAKTARELMAIRNEAAEKERPQRIAELIPGLSHNACTRMRPVRWPDQFFLTATISPIGYKWAPLPSVVYYDWKEAGGQVAIMHVPWAVPPVRVTISALKKGIGYSIERTPNGASQCISDSPGLVRPDWMASAGCRCSGVLDHSPELSPDDVTQVLSCPIKEQGQRVMWNWYTTEGRPILFMEPGAMGNGVNIADYHRWMPGKKMAAVDFALPKMCFAPGNTGLPAAATSSCSDCHTTSK